MPERSTAESLGAGSSLNSHPELSQAVCSALENSDMLVLVLEPEGKRLRIVAANAKTQQTTGFAGQQLEGRDLALLAGPETDAGAFAALQDAGLHDRPHQTQLRCRTAEGKPFWFGLQLVPANEPGRPGRCLIIGRDITREVRERQQDQAVQSLLAKVFLMIDVPVYIIGQHGRFLMTNPAFDRLLGCAPNSLLGAAALDRYAARSQQAVQAARAQQENDGLDYTIEAVLIGLDEREIACTIASAVVQGADLPRLQVTTIRPVQRAASPVSVSAGGRIQLIGLEEVRDELGPRWAAMQDRAMATAEHVLRRRLGQADTFSRTDDNGFVLCFAGATEEEAAFRSASIGREIRQRLIGLGETAEVAHVFAAATALPPEAEGLSAGELSTMVRDRIAQRLRSIQEAARKRLFAALEDASYATEIVRARGRDETMGALVCLPQATERAIEAAIAVLPSAETAGLDMDTMRLGFAHEYATAAATQNLNEPIFVPLSSEVLLIRKRMEACLDLCRTIPERLRQLLVLVVSAPPEEAARQLSTGLARLRPFCRSLGLALDTLGSRELDVNAHGVTILLIDAALCRPGWEAKAKARMASLNAPRCRLMVRGAETAHVRALFLGGADLVSTPQTRAPPGHPDVTASARTG